MNKESLNLNVRLNVDKIENEGSKVKLFFLCCVCVFANSPIPVHCPTPLSHFFGSLIPLRCPTSLGPLFLLFIAGEDHPKRCFCRYLPFLAAYLRLPVPTLLVTREWSAASDWIEENVLIPFNQRRDAFIRESMAAKKKIRRLRRFLGGWIDTLRECLTENCDDEKIRYKYVASSLPLKLKYKDILKSIKGIMKKLDRVVETDSEEMKLAIGLDTESSDVGG